MPFSFSEIDLLCVDLDDTIIVYDAVSEPSWREVCAVHAPGLDILPDRLYAEITSVAGSYWSDPDNHRAGRLRLDSVRCELVLRSLHNLGRADAAAAERIARDFTVLRESRLELFPGAANALSALSQQVDLCLVTNGESHKQRGKVERFALGPFFSKILIEEETGVGKPDPRVFTHACSVCGAAPERAAMIGDNLVWDVHAPRQIGMKGIWNDFRGRGLPENSRIIPDLIVRSLSEFAASLS